MIHKVSRIAQQVRAANEFHDVALNVGLIVLDQQTFDYVLRAVHILDFQGVELHRSARDSRELQAKVGHEVYNRTICFLCTVVRASLLKDADFDGHRGAFESLDVDCVLVLSDQIGPPSHELISLIFVLILRVLVTLFVVNELLFFLLLDTRLLGCLSELHCLFGL